MVNGGYEMKQLGDFAEIKSGGTPSRKIKEYWNNGNIIWLKSEVCKNKIIYDNDDYEKITEEGLKNSNAKWFDKNITLIALVGATKGKTGFLKFKATTNQNIAGIKSINNNLLNYYIFIYLQFSYEEIIKDLSQYDMLNLNHIKNIKIPFPALDIQKELVQKVEQLEQKINAAQSILDGASNRKERVLEREL